MLGKGALVDAGSVGSHAHRLQCNWTNITYHWELWYVVTAILRVVNIEGGARRLLLALISYPRSKALCPDDITSYTGPREVLNSILGEWEEPNKRERELMMGMRAGNF